MKKKGTKKRGTKQRRSRESLVSRLFMLIFLAAAVVIGISPKEGSEGSDILDTVIPKKVELTAGSFEASADSLTAVIYPGETALLNEFDGLTRVDLRGSTCYDEIVSWAKAHPETQVIYDVELPNGKHYDNSAVSADLTGTGHDGLEKTLQQLAYLPDVNAFDLGSCDGGEASFTADDMQLVMETYPDAEFTYSFTLAGQTVDSSTTALDLQSAGHDEIAAVTPLLSRMSGITEINMGSAGEGGLSFEDVGMVQEICPQAAVEYHFSLFGKDISTLDEKMDFWHVAMNDGGAGVRSVLPYMKNCSYVDMDTCGISNEDMAALQADFPDTKLVWRIWFAKEYSVRTDVEKILASKPSVGGTVYDSDASVLQYCHDLKYLDLGHNECITNISFAYGMPNLEVLVIAMNPLTDISPLASCQHLEYVELNSTNITDLSPLSELKELRHLNICNCEGITDISPLYGLTELERLWIGCVDPVPAEQVAEMQAAAPDCKIETTTLDPTQGGWRYVDLNDKGWRTWEKYGYFDFDLDPRYELLQKQFGYLEAAYSFSWLDPLY